jgi:ATP-dependent RNA helicase DDX1
MQYHSGVLPLFLLFSQLAEVHTNDMAGGFDSLGLMAELVRGVDELGWLLPTDVQDEAIPLILGGGDVMVASETGSGKTAAFALPMIQCVHERLRQSLDYNKHPPGGKVKSSGGGKVSRHVAASADDKDSLLSVGASGLDCECTSQQQ